jgi:hypothetical protein
MAENAAVSFDLHDGLCPLCYRSVAGRAHRRYLDGDLTVCDDNLLGCDFPRQPGTMEPLLMQAPYADDPWLFGVACIHAMGVTRPRAEERFAAFRERWPVGGALLFEANPTAEMLFHYQPLGLAKMRARLTWQLTDTGEESYTGYPREAWRILRLEDLTDPTEHTELEAWRRWRLWQMGVRT